METVHIETSHNVALHYEVATIADRGIALLFDGMMMAGYCMLLGMAIAITRLELPEWALMVLFTLPIAFYHLISEIVMDGQSVGKRARHIKVARLDGGQAGLGDYLLRWVLRFVDSFFFLGAIVIIFNGKGQRLGDIAAGTTVISLKQRTGLSDTLGKDIPVEHDVTFPDAPRLNDDHARLIKEVLNNTSEVRPTLIAKLARRIQQELVIRTELTPEAFLRTLLKDYLYLTSRGA